MSFDIFEHFATDEQLECTGVWHELDKASGARVRVARSGNRAYAKALTQAVELNRTALDAGGELAEARSDAILVEVMAQTVLLDFEGLSYRGQTMPYSQANARVLLGVKDFRKRISQWAEDASRYRAQLELEQGNVLAPT